jgi:hypothetical protein
MTCICSEVRYYLARPIGTSYACVRLYYGYGPTLTKRYPLPIKVSFLIIQFTEIVILARQSLPTRTAAAWSTVLPKLLKSARGGQGWQRLKWGPRGVGGGGGDVVPWVLTCAGVPHPGTSALDFNQRACLPKFGCRIYDLQH